jgi:hypothetical protein
MNSHPSLAVGDIVRMSESPGDCQNLFIRENDHTIHKLQGDCGYVVCVELPG